MPPLQKAVAEWLRTQRTERGFSQEAVAEGLGMKRSTYATLEKGERKIGIEEVADIARLFEVGLANLIDELQNERPSIGRLRAVQVDVKHADFGLGFEKIFNRVHPVASLAKKLEAFTHRGDIFQINVPAPKSKIHAVQQGAYLATHIREVLDLGVAPLPRMTDVARHMGVKLLLDPLQQGVSGLYFDHEETGPIIVINSKEPETRKRFSAAHELCHRVADHDRELVVTPEDPKKKDLCEVRADAFAANLLAPEDGVQEFLRVRAMHPDVLDEFDVCDLAAHFGTSYQSMVYRLYNIGMISTKDQLGTFLSGAEELKKHAREVWPPNRIEADSTETTITMWALGIGVKAVRKGILQREDAAAICRSAGVNDHMVETFIINQQPLTGTFTRPKEVYDGLN